MVIPVAAAEFTGCAVDGVWLWLQRLGLPLGDLADGVVASIIRSMKWCVEWEVASSQFGAQSFRALQDHFSTLVNLDFRECDGVTSKMIQEILVSRAQLKPSMDIGHIVEGLSWGCSSLDTLDVFIEFDEEVPDMTRYLQQQVYGQLSRLRNLATLSIGVKLSTPTQGLTPWYSSGFDLRISAGLAMLDGLTRMARIEFTGTSQEMQKEDVLWMFDHWERLEKVDGILNSGDMESNGILSTESMLCSAPRFECHVLRRLSQVASSTALFSHPLLMPASGISFNSNPRTLWT